MHPLAAADEQGHASDGSPGWQESWDLDFWTPDGALAGFVRVTCRGAGHPMWFVAALVGPGRRPVSVVDLDVPAPRRGDLELRTTGLWVDVQCLVPYDHVTVGLECFGVALDDPADAVGDGRGERVPVGLDLEWDTAEALGPDGAAGYALACRVHGEVLVADEHHAVDGWGRRSHVWGRHRRGPHSPPRSWVHGRLDDGRWVDTPMPSTELATDPVAWAAVPVPDGADLGGAVVAWWRGSCILRAADGTRGHGWVHRIEEVPPR